MFVRVQLPPTAPYFAMDDTLIETFKQWNITSVLPLQVGDFQLSTEYRMIRDGDEDVEYDLFRYQNDRNGWSVRALYNPASGEFLVRTDIGMLEFALIEFITDDWKLFQSLVETRLERIIRDYYVDVSRNFSVILKHKGLPDVDWDSFLPAEYKGMKRLIRPNEAVRIINGSYMILSYYEKTTQSGLSVMYNVLRDDFFAERRVHNFPNLVHDFDSTEVKDLRQALATRLVPVLDSIAADMQQPLTQGD